METGTGIVLLLMLYTACGAAVEVISVNGVKPPKSSPDMSGSSASFSMPVQYSMAAPALASAQRAAASLTSAAPSYEIISTTQRPTSPPSHTDWIPKPFIQRSKPLQDYGSQLLNSRLPYNRRISFSAGYAASEPHFESDNEYGPQYHYKSPTYSSFQHFQPPNIHQSYPSTYESYISYTPPPSYQQYHQHSAYSKPYLFKHLSHYNPHAHDLLDFPIYSHKGGLGDSSSSYYKLMFPLALLGLGIPAIGLMYTYLSRRRRRDLNSDFHPTPDDLRYYLNILQTGLQRFQETVDNEGIIKQYP
ncbi:uncharacterized protein LOC117282832 [Cryptotermes secundus]|nr:uncharacterized protein LOC117282832 [Cryptotermes secundus]